MKRRLIVVPLIRRADGRYLLIKMPLHRGVFPGQWGLPGGGVEEGERLEEALRREVREELQLELATMDPLYFKGQVHEKLLPSGERQTMYMVFLIYACTTDGRDPVINEEFDAFAWVAVDEFDRYDMNEETRITLCQAGVIGAAATPLPSDSSNP
jgi:nucleoside triphosphatase